MTAHTVSKILPRQDLKCQGPYGKVKSKSSMILHTYIPPTNIPAKNQLPLTYSFQDITETRL